MKCLIDEALLKNNNIHFRVKIVTRCYSAPQRNIFWALQYRLSTYVSHLLLLLSDDYVYEFFFTSFPQLRLPSFLYNCSETRTKRIHNDDDPRHDI